MIPLIWQCPSTKLQQESNYYPRSNRKSYRERRCSSSLTVLTSFQWILMSLLIHVQCTLLYGSIQKDCHWNKKVVQCSSSICNRHLISLSSQSPAQDHKRFSSDHHPLVMQLWYGLRTLWTLLVRVTMVNIVSSMCKSMGAKEDALFPSSMDKFMTLPG